MTTEKQKYPAALARKVAGRLLLHLAPHCERIEIVGSLRRGKDQVGDVELLYIPRYDAAMLPGEMFPQAEQNLVDLAIEQLLLAGMLEKRRNVNGSEMYGEKNKLVRDTGTALPLDLFAASHENWFNYLVCRTGGAKSNMAICNAAIARGWKWNPYGPGFSRPCLNHTPPGLREPHEIRRMASEREVFEFVGLPYLPPEERP